MIYFSHISRILKMEDMKINSKTDYERYRVNSGNGPHRILEMLQEEALKESDQTKFIEEARIEAWRKK